MSAQDVHVFICRGCGKRSYAKRDPIAHERREKHDTDYGERWEHVWCGPFDRYIATLALQAEPQQALHERLAGDPAASCPAVACVWAAGGGAGEPEATAMTLPPEQVGPVEVRRVRLRV
jgi:hypothetical protein